MATRGMIKTAHQSIILASDEQGFVPLMGFSKALLKLFKHARMLIIFTMYRVLRKDWQQICQAVVG